jgi:hypothetical protein
VLYAAVPNLARGLVAARDVFESRLAESATLRQWWDVEVVSRGLDRQIDDLLDQMEPLADALGDEIAVALPMAALEGGGGPLVLAELDDPVAFRRIVESGIAGPDAGLPADERPVFVDSPSLADTLVRLESSLGTVDGVPDRPLHRRLAEEYARGASWLVGADLEAILDHSGAGDRAMLDRLGLLDAKTLVVEHHRDDAGSATTAALDFDGPRRGIAAWLARPAALGSLEYVSPQAAFAAAAVTRDAADMLDDLADALAAHDPNALAELDRFESEIGIDLRSDLGAALGGEGAVAQDGPLLPVPWWTAVLEVYDPDSLRMIVERAVDRANPELARHGRPLLEIRDHAIHGLPAVTVAQVGGPIAVTWVVQDGYLVAGPDTAAVSHALDVRASGLTLPRSAAFRDLLPADAAADCSAVVYRDFGHLTGLLEGAAGSHLPPEAVEVLRASAEPSLLCVQGGIDRIAISGRGGSLLGAGPLTGLATLTDTVLPVSSPR